MLTGPVARSTSRHMTLLGRLLLAICVAFVFAGRMEAATSHCARLVEGQSVAASQPASVSPVGPVADASPCHDMAGNAAMADAPAPAKSAPAAPCDCIAMIKACSPQPTLMPAVHDAPWLWAAPADLELDSLIRDVEGKPPRPMSAAL